MSKGSKQRPTNKEAFDKNYDAIFNKEKDKKSFKHIQQDSTELNGDGNRERGRYGEDLSVDE